MRRRRAFLYFVLSFVIAVASARMLGAEKSAYEKGKLIDLQRYGSGSGAARAQGSFCFAIELGDTTYLARHEAYWRWSYEPTDFVVGDPIEVKIKGNDLYLKKPKGGDLKTSISRRERNVSGKPRVDCSLPVSVRN
jgi:hypothetical protein